MAALTEAERNEEHRVGARLRIQNALGFLEAADAMMAAGNVGIHPFAFYVNLCFWYELSLKAFLAHRKWSGKEGAGGLGHDLETALAEALALDYAPPADMPEMIQILGPLSKGMDLRYLKAAAVRLPASDEQAIAVARAHRDALARQLPISDLG